MNPRVLEVDDRVTLVVLAANKVLPIRSPNPCIGKVTVVPLDVRDDFAV